MNRETLSKLELKALVLGINGLLEHSNNEITNLINWDTTNVFSKETFETTFIQAVHKLQFNMNRLELNKIESLNITQGSYDMLKNHGINTVCEAMVKIAGLMGDPARWVETILGGCVTNVDGAIGFTTSARNDMSEFNASLVPVVYTTLGNTSRYKNQVLQLTNIEQTVEHFDKQDKYDCLRKYRKCDTMTEFNLLDENGIKMYKVIVSTTFTECLQYPFDTVPTRSSVTINQCQTNVSFIPDKLNILDMLIKIYNISGIKINRENVRQLLYHMHTIHIDNHNA